MRTRDTTTKIYAYSSLLILALTGLALEIYVSANRAGAYFDNPILDGLNFFSFFTALSNVIVVVAALDILKNHKTNIVLQTMSLAAIGSTFFIHRLFLAKPFDGEPLHVIVSDLMLHVVVPLLTWILFIIFKETSSTSVVTMAKAFAFPLTWTAATLIRGAAFGWYPYDFVDPTESSWISIITSLLGAHVVFGILIMIARFIRK